MKLVVFTTVLGAATDPLRPIVGVNHAVEYRCYTDQLVPPTRGWKMVYLTEPLSDTPSIVSRRLKILAHATLADANPDVSLWLDAAFQLHCDPVPLAEQWMAHAEMVALRHPHRNSIEQEAAAILRLEMVPAALIAAQLDAARHDGFDIMGRGVITSTGFCMRRHTPRVNAFNEMWWRLFDQGGHTRDQMTVDWALWRSGVDVRYLEGHYRDNPYARWFPHGSRPAGGPLLTRQQIRRRLIRR